MNKNNKIIYPHSFKGFSLLELMVVISIISLLATVSISPMNRLQIKVARAEMNLNINLLRATGKSIYVDSQGTATASITYSFGWFNIGLAPAAPYDCNGASSPWGKVFHEVDCLNLRYHYVASVNTDGTVSVTAVALRGGWVSYGNKKIMNLAFCNSGYYVDYWMSTADAAPVIGVPGMDITLHCP